jgi:tryptophan synthase beta chain
MMMYTLGHKFMPPAIHAGGLRYHGMSPMVSHALKLGLIEAEACHQTEVFAAATQFAQTEGLVPAPESAHAIASVIRAANQAREEGRKQVILFNLSGHGLLDLSAYETYQTGKMQDA